MGPYIPVTDFDIQALIDNELDGEDEKRIRAFIEKNEDAKRRYDELKEQKSLIQKWRNNRFFH